jgi:hypothetical protein
MSNTPNQAARNRAYKIRAAIRNGESISDEDAAWLEEYEANQKKPPAFGASQSLRKLSVDLEESQQAVGTGDAAEAAAAGQLAFQEGRRIDYLSRIGVDALKDACKMYREMATIMKERMVELEHVHLEMLESVRAQYLARTQAEINEMQAEAEARQLGEKEGGGDEITRMALEMFKPHIARTLIKSAVGQSKKKKTGGE